MIPQRYPDSNPPLQTQFEFPTENAIQKLLQCTFENPGSAVSELSKLEKSQTKLRYRLGQSDGYGTYVYRCQHHDIGCKSFIVCKAILPGHQLQKQKAATCRIVKVDNQHRHVTDQSERHNGDGHGAEVSDRVSVVKNCVQQNGFTKSLLEERLKIVKLIFRKHNLLTHFRDFLSEFESATSSAEQSQRQVRFPYSLPEIIRKEYSSAIFHSYLERSLPQSFEKGVRLVFIDTWLRFDFKQTANPANDMTEKLATVRYLFQVPKIFSTIVKDQRILAEYDLLFLELVTVVFCVLNGVPQSQIQLGPRQFDKHKTASTQIRDSLEGEYQEISSIVHCLQEVFGTFFTQVSQQTGSNPSSPANRSEVGLNFNKTNQQQKQIIAQQLIIRTLEPNVQKNIINDIGAIKRQFLGEGIQRKTKQCYKTEVIRKINRQFGINQRLTTNRNLSKSQPRKKRVNNDQEESFKDEKLIILSSSDGQLSEGLLHEQSSSKEQKALPSSRLQDYLKTHNRMIQNQLLDREYKMELGEQFDQMEQKEALKDLKELEGLRQRVSMRSVVSQQSNEQNHDIFDRKVGIKVEKSQLSEDPSDLRKGKGKQFAVVRQALQDQHSQSNGVQSSSQTSESAEEIQAAVESFEGSQNSLRSSQGIIESAGNSSNI